MVLMEEYHPCIDKVAAVGKSALYTNRALFPLVACNSFLFVNRNEAGGDRRVLFAENAGKAPSTLDAILQDGHVGLQHLDSGISFPLGSSHPTRHF